MTVTTDDSYCYRSELAKIHGSGTGTCGGIGSSHASADCDLMTTSGDSPESGGINLRSTTKIGRDSRESTRGLATLI